MTKAFVIIPARSGSKGITNKNIQYVAGKPLLCHAYLTALELVDPDSIFISTDSNDYLDLASSFLGINVTQPLRAALHSQDTSLITEALIEDVRRFKIPGASIISVIEPSFLCNHRSSLIRRAFDTLVAGKADSLCGVYVVPDKYRTSKQLEGSLDRLLPNSHGVNRQSLPPTYVRSGHFYATYVHSLMSDGHLYSGNLSGLVSPKESFNIDSYDDLIAARTFFDSSQQPFAP